jgi:hypothetical protein
MSKENPLWGAPRIHGELLKLGFEIAESTVSKYIVQRRGPPPQNWRTFLRNHADAIASFDLCVVPTLTFDCLFAFCCSGPRTAAAAVVRGDPASDGGVAGPTDRGGISVERGSGLSGARQWGCIRAGLHAASSDDGHTWSTNITEIAVAECICWTTDWNARHVLIFGVQHLRQILTSYSSYYNKTRTHLSLDKDAPLRRAVQRCGTIVATPILSGLHHQYARIW